MKIILEPLSDNYKNGSTAQYIEEGYFIGRDSHNRLFVIDPEGAGDGYLVAALGFVANFFLCYVQDNYNTGETTYTIKGKTIYLE